LLKNKKARPKRPGSDFVWNSLKQFAYSKPGHSWRG